MKKIPKISIIGAGNVGSTCALFCAQKNLGQIILFDVVEGMPQGKALDIAQSSPVLGFEPTITGTNSFAETKDSDLYIITAGVARKPGMDRLDLLKINAEIVKSTCEQIKKYSPNAIVIVVSNPVDVMTYLAYKITGFDSSRVIGQAGVLDSSRFSYFIADYTKKSICSVTSMVLGGHGDTMVPVTSLAQVEGKPAEKIIAKAELEKLVDRARKGGGEIVNLLKTGSAYYAPAASTVAMAEALILNKRNVMPCSVLCSGQYGIVDTFVGVPARLGKKGVEKIEEIDLPQDDLIALQTSARVYKESYNDLNRIGVL